MTPIAEIALDLSYTDTKVWARVYAPARTASDEEWSCSFEISEPLAVERTIYGGSSLQALMLALKTMSSYLYGSRPTRISNSVSAANSAEICPSRLQVSSSTPPLFHSERVCVVLSPPSFL